MNFMGMGIAEIGVVMLVAFLVLGPNRTINLARTAGKLFGDLRRTFGDVAAAVNMEEKGQAASPIQTRPGEHQPVAQPQPSPDDSSPENSVPDNSVSEDTTGTATAEPNPANPGHVKNEDE